MVEMGANISGGVSDTDFPLKPRLGDIPESCVASVLMYLDPPEICKLARLNRAFRAASSADFIWESKLPPNYLYIAEKLFDEKTLMKLGKRDIYARLCAPNSFDDGTKELWLDRRTGGVCMSLSSKGLSITGIDDRRYWNHISTEESRFRTVAYLQQIWWLEIDGELDFQFPADTYSMFFRLRLGKSSKRRGRRVSNSENIHGWQIKPVSFQLTTSDGQEAVTKCYLDNPGDWIHYHVGDFVVGSTNSSMNIKFSMTQIDCTHTKGGLSVDSVFIYPKSVGKRLDIFCRQEEL